MSRGWLNLETFLDAHDGGHTMAIERLYYNMTIVQKINFVLELSFVKFVKN